MIGFIKGWVLDITVVVVILVLVEMLVPSGRIKNFLNVITGIIIIIIVVQPLLKLFSGGYDLSLPGEIGRSLEVEVGAHVAGTGFREEQAKQIAMVYREKLVEGIERAARGIDGIKGVKADVTINEDYNSIYFGEIKKVYLYVLIEDGNTDGKEKGRQEDVGFRIIPVEKIGKIQISMGKLGESGQEETGKEGVSRETSRETGGAKSGESTIEDKTGDKEGDLMESKNMAIGNGDELARYKIAETLENRISSFLAIKKEDVVISFK
ncbi:MAG: hypothetical protein GX754_11540 [Clostridiaceae bacterium]|nr:hypothetical protein [Clostridiaceae bacterium]